MENFNIILTIFYSSGDFKVYTTAPFSDILCHVETNHLPLNESLLPGFSMKQVFTERCLQADFHFSFNVNVDVTVVSNMNSNLSEMKLYNILQQCINSVISRTVKSGASNAALF